MKSHSNDFSYRRDIDGLRFLAVLAVVIFHAFPLWLPGGFVGVDVFFVISGFLITGIIFKDIQKDKFSFISFYARRFRRLLPALLLVILVTWLGGLLLFLPDELKALGKHVMGASTFTTNLILWKESGYFDASAETKPLLHLWSLAVEEQFYLLWPTLLFFSLKQKKIQMLSVILLLFTASLFFNIDQIKYGAPSVFFGMTTRFWQFMAGASLVFLSENKLNMLNRWVKEFIVLLGLSAILIPCFKFNSGLLYPGWWAIAPTFGTAALIYVRGQSNIVKIFLNNPVPVYLGLISYPLYLWHWPLLSILHITEGSKILASQLWVAVGLSFLLAVLTYEFLEKPAQKFLDISKPKFPKKIVQGSLLILALVLSFGFGTYKKHSKQFRFMDPYPVHARPA